MVKGLEFFVIKMGKIFIKTVALADRNNFGPNDVSSHGNPHLARGTYYAVLNVLTIKKFPQNFFAGPEVLIL